MSEHQTPKLVVAEATGMVLPQARGLVQTAQTMEKALREKLAEMSLVKCGTRMEAVVDTLIDKAENGDLKAAEIVMNRVLGTPKATNENVNVNAGLSEWLETMRKRRADTQPNVVEVDIV